MIANTKTLNRAAAVGSFAVGGLYIALPLFRGIVAALLARSEEAFTDPANALADSWEGIYGLVIFVLIGTGILVVVIAVDALVRAKLDTVWARISLVFGVVAAVGALLAGFSSRAMFSLIGASLAETGASHGAQLAALQSANITNGAFLLALTVGLSIWLVGLATMGRKAGLVGMPTAVFCVAVAAIVIAAQVGFTFFGVQFAFVPMFLGLGIAFTIRARKITGVSAAVE